MKQMNPKQNNYEMILGLAYKQEEHLKKMKKRIDNLEKIHKKIMRLL